MHAEKYQGSPSVGLLALCCYYVSVCNPGGVTSTMEISTMASRQNVAVARELSVCRCLYRPCEVVSAQSKRH
jgi:hypothetical protein